MPKKKQKAKNKKMAKKPVKKPLDKKAKDKLLKKKRKKRRNRYKGKKRRNQLIITFMTFLILFFVSIISFGLYIIFSAPSFNEKEFYNSESTIVLDLNGDEIAKLGAQKRELISYEELPQVFVDAIIATEDSRFFQHNGFDIARFTKATLGQLSGNSSAGGGSTITMQISKNYLTNNVATGIEGLTRKFTDVYLSIFKIEKDYTKQEIIEFYINRPYLGAGIYGVEEAAQVYFGKSIKNVSLPEAAIIAGLFQAPDTYNPYKNIEATEKRKNIVLNLMLRHGYINEKERDIAQSMETKNLVRNLGNESVKYQAFIDTVAEEVKKITGKDPYNVPMIIYSTMDPKVQDSVNDVTNGVTHKFVNDVVQVGIAVTSVKDGSVVAVGGGRNKVGELTFNYATQIKRHPGSTAKPYMVYGPGFEFAKWSAATPLFDEPWSFSTGGSIKNADNNYQGMMSVRKALAKSRNIPAVQGFQQLDNKAVVKFAQSLGITIDLGEGGLAFESAAIGGFDGVSPLIQSAAYAAFGRGGYYIEPFSFTKIVYRDDDKVFENTKKPVKVMEKTTAFLVNDILKGAVSGGLIGSTKISNTDLCGKTGTSTFDSSFRKKVGLPASAIMDSWVVMYSPDYSTAQWYGYHKMTKEMVDKNQYLVSSAGVRARKSIAQSLTNNIMKNNSKFEETEGVKKVTVELDTIPLSLPSEFTPSNLKTTDWFISGTEPTEVSKRFSQLDNVTNINHTYNSTSGALMLAWTPINTPEMSTSEGILNYYKNGFAEFSANYNSKVNKKVDALITKYQNRRINYNAANIGTITYQVYIKNGDGSLNLIATTSNNQYTHNTFTPNNLKFVVKTAYSIFKSNASSGDTYTVTTSNPNPIIPGDTTSSSTTIELRLRGNAIVKESIKDANYIDVEDPVKVLDKGNPVTESSTIVTEFYNSDNVKIANIPLNVMATYQVKYLVTYKGVVYTAYRIVEVK